MIFFFFFLKRKKSLFKQQSLRFFSLDSLLSGRVLFQLTTESLMGDTLTNLFPVHRHSTMVFQQSVASSVSAHILRVHVKVDSRKTLLYQYNFEKFLGREKQSR